MAFLEISVAPVGTNTPSFSSYVSQAVEVVQQSGLQYQVTPTATVIEGDLNQLMDVAKQIHQKAMSAGANRVITHISIDERNDKSTNMQQQVQSVQQ
ncbi:MULTISPECIES: MTH1187 family thiamine-binding protein [Thermoactinomyces]|uniref:MTH1187 family thiamine-binding protein n=1 Tax=Thermoactinomyces daqus TaxID=1329516 RepID=A0A7W1XCP7_9BACL|nr:MULTISPECIES: MTH1187 family thiamine-binding protein [Thermoactinomyces]MBA4544196.1 MTH1187 family thiamine-binding protein [Thermoactinomyces daqus]MBH8597956.1 MTH1187 family thiamine-binding protein [Thermoactinomyces sp. CICC 10523]MBH8604310.1 MTH1187 family thiamine-binding protein [Thermoactinomyces sp. CICC 10522]MBH8607765.1 MTH1187 family thiamine-binding protein [Thermoactinomyces sp. CICC 10521]